MASVPPPRPVAGIDSGSAQLALGDLRAVELATGVAGPYCGKLLADYGADVIKVELPLGDPSRLVGPFPDGRRDAGALFLWLNANKRSLVLDWHRASGRRILRHLLAKADVLIESGPRSTLARWRLNYASLAKLNPRLVVASITPFGNTGPWGDRPATDLTISALGGQSFTNGMAGREPLKEPGPQTEVVGGIFGCIGTLCALADRARTGEGQAVDVSSLEAVLGIMTPYVTQVSYQGRHWERLAAGAGSLYACEDGYASVYSPNQNGWNFLIETLNLGPEAKEPEVATEYARRTNPERVRQILAPALALLSKHEVFHSFALGRVNASMVLSVPELKEDPHVQDRGFFTPVDDPRAGKIDYPGPPFRIEGCEWHICRPAPRLGEHTDEVLETVLGYGRRHRSALRRVNVVK